jgi:iron-sulfur cluster repair protein YtfE (RIC family)
MVNSFSHNMTISTLIKMRPMAIGLLEKRKIRLWESMETPVSHLFQGNGLEDFLEEISKSKIPMPDTEWSAMPLYLLVDFLTHEHRNMFLGEVSDITHLLDIYSLADSAEAKDLQVIQAAFSNFVKDFETHVEDEESYLFPKILRYEACLRDRRVHPEFHKGSLRNYMASPMAKQDNQFYIAGETIAQQMRALELDYPEAIAGSDLVKLMDSLNDKLHEHNELESKTLFATAIELERSLYNMSIDGHPAMASQRRGPMDSGIMRLSEG